VVGPRQELTVAGFRTQAFPGTDQRGVVAGLGNGARAESGGEEDEAQGESPFQVGLP
jgi:hypothetical protein